jgi:hypothetical protein
VNVLVGIIITILLPISMGLLAERLKSSFVLLATVRLLLVPVILSWLYCILGVISALVLSMS